MAADTWVGLQGFVPELQSPAPKSRSLVLQHRSRVGPPVAILVASFEATKNLGSGFEVLLSNFEAQPTKCEAQPPNAEAQLQGVPKPTLWSPRIRITFENELKAPALDFRG